MSDILVISGHPNYKSSFANRAILDDIHRQLPHADIVYLDAEYPDWNIDVKREQDRLVKAKTLVFEFPFWWFGAPSLMHRYVEQVFTHGFAYGEKGVALHGKSFILSFTTGAAEPEYNPNGTEGFTMEQFMTPFKALIKFTGFAHKGNVISYDMMLLDHKDEARKQAVMARAGEHAAKLASLIQSTL